jgi:Flp pilus assembly protein TadG
MMRKREGRWLTARRKARRRARPRLLGRGSDGGASAIELVILAPALIFVSMLVIQFALWLDASHAALAAAQEGDRAAREAEFTSSGWQQTATDVAMNYYHGLDTSVLGDVSVSNVNFDAATNTVALTVSGRLTGIFPLTITETVTGPVECFRTAQSEGTNCG